MVSDETPAGLVRHAISLLVASGEPYVGPEGKRIGYAEDDVTAMKTWLWRAIGQLEGEPHGP